MQHQVPELVREQHETFLIAQRGVVLEHSFVAVDLRSAAVHVRGAQRGGIDAVHAVQMRLEPREEIGAWGAVNGLSRFSSLGARVFDRSHGDSVSRVSTRTSSAPQVAPTP